MFAKENRFEDLIAAAAKKWALPVWVIKTTIGKESSFEPTAFHRDYDGGVSRGLMQLRESTARALGYKGPFGNDATKTGGLYDPAVSIEYGSKTLWEIRRRRPSVEWAEIYDEYNQGGAARGVKGPAVEQMNEGQVAGWQRIALYFNPKYAEAHRRPFWRPASSRPAGRGGPGSSPASS